MKISVMKTAIVTAAIVGVSPMAFADGAAKNVILMISDGGGSTTSNSPTSTPV